MIHTTIIIFAVFFALMLVGVIVGLIFAVKRSTPAGKGDVGENAVAKALQTVAGKQYLVNDLLFASSGQTCQIDHVFINRNGVWVIETKNYAGVILGNEDDREWTQILENTENKFYNPVKQNITHIYRLKKAIKADDYFFNIVVFTARADLTGVQSDCVLSIQQLSIIQERDTGITLSQQQMERYYERLLRLKNNSNVTKEEHVENIRTMQRHIQNGFCPHCGVKLILRKFENKEFHSCPNYPKCTFKKEKE